LSPFDAAGSSVAAPAPLLCHHVGAWHVSTVQQGFKKLWV
jgi:hypothetical protein